MPPTTDNPNLKTMIKIALRLLLVLLPLGGMARTQQDSLRVLWIGTAVKRFSVAGTTVTLGI